MQNRRKLAAVGTAPNGKHPNIEMLDEIDMVEFKRVLQAQVNAQQAQEQAARMLVGAQSIAAFFMDGIRSKYKLSDQDQVAGSGQILRA